MAPDVTKHTLPSNMPPAYTWEKGNWSGMAPELVLVWTLPAAAEMLRSNQFTESSVP